MRAQKIDSNLQVLFSPFVLPWTWKVVSSVCGLHRKTRSFVVYMVTEDISFPICILQERPILEYFPDLKMKKDTKIKFNVANFIHSLIV